MRDNPRDTQRQRVYNWEAPWCDGAGTLPLAECEALVARVWAREHRLFGQLARPPRVRDGRGRRRASGSASRITLPRWSRSREVILHEIAHGLNPSLEPHGPKFVAVYIHLLARYAGMDAEALWLSANKARVAVAWTWLQERKRHHRARRSIVSPITTQSAPSRAAESRA